MIYKKIIKYEQIPDTLEELIEKIAPSIIRANMLNKNKNNVNDILFAIINNYEVCESIESVESKIKKYLESR